MFKVMQMGLKKISDVFDCQVKFRCSRGDMRGLMRGRKCEWGCVFLCTCKGEVMIVLT